MQRKRQRLDLVWCSALMRLIKKLRLELRNDIINRGDVKFDDLLQRGDHRRPESVHDLLNSIADIRNMKIKTSKEKNHVKSKDSKNLDNAAEGVRNGTDDISLTIQRFLKKNFDSGVVLHSRNGITKNNIETTGSSQLKHSKNSQKGSMNEQEEEIKKFFDSVLQMESSNVPSKTINDEKKLLINKIDVHNNLKKTFKENDVSREKNRSKKIQPIRMTANRIPKTFLGELKNEFPGCIIDQKTKIISRVSKTMELEQKSRKEQSTIRGKDKPHIKKSPDPLSKNGKGSNVTATSNRRSSFHMNNNNLTVERAVLNKNKDIVSRIGDEYKQLTFALDEKKTTGLKRSQADPDDLSTDDSLENLKYFQQRKNIFFDTKGGFERTKTLKTNSSEIMNEAAKLNETGERNKQIDRDYKLQKEYENKDNRQALIGVMKRSTAERTGRQQMKGECVGCDCNYKRILERRRRLDSFFCQVTKGNSKVKTLDEIKAGIKNIISSENKTDNEGISNKKELNGNERLSIETVFVLSDEESGRETDDC